LGRALRVSRTRVRIGEPDETASRVDELADPAAPLTAVDNGSET
jgi:hypothetical protein